MTVLAIVCLSCWAFVVGAATTGRKVIGLPLWAVAVSSVALCVWVLVG